MDEQTLLNLQQLNDYYDQMRQRVDAMYAIDGVYRLQAPRRFFINQEIRPEPFPANIGGNVPPVRGTVEINPTYVAAKHEEIIIKGKHPFKMYYQRPKAIQLELFPE